MYKNAPVVVLARALPLRRETKECPRCHVTRQSVLQLPDCRHYLCEKCLPQRSAKIPDTQDFMTVCSVCTQENTLSRARFGQLPSFTSSSSSSMPTQLAPMSSLPPPPSASSSIGGIDPNDEVYVCTDPEAQHIEHCDVLWPKEYKSDRFTVHQTGFVATGNMRFKHVRETYTSESKGKFVNSSDEEEEEDEHYDIDVQDVMKCLKTGQKLKKRVALAGMVELLGILWDDE